MKLIDVIRAGALGGTVGVVCWIVACIIAAIFGETDWMEKNSYAPSNWLMAAGVLFGIVWSLLPIGGVDPSTER